MEKFTKGDVDGKEEAKVTRGVYRGKQVRSAQGPEISTLEDERVPSSMS